MEKETKFQTSKADKVFTLVRDNENKTRIVLGDSVVSQKRFDTFDQANKYIGRKPWELILNSTLVMINYHHKLAERAEQKDNDTKSGENV